MPPNVAIAGEESIERSEPLHQLPPARARRKPAPPAFGEVFTRVGWRGVEEAYGARTSCNRRWIDECGGEALLQARRAYRDRLREIRQARAA